MKNQELRPDRRPAIPWQTRRGDGVGFLHFPPLFMSLILFYLRENKRCKTVRFGCRLGALLAHDDLRIRRRHPVQHFGCGFHYACFCQIACNGKTRSPGAGLRFKPERFSCRRGDWALQEHAAGPNGQWHRGRDGCWRDNGVPATRPGVQWQASGYRRR